MTSSARLAAYTTFVAVDAAKNQSGYPINLLDEEEVVQTRKTITIDAASGKLKVGAESTAGGVGDGSHRRARIVCEIDFNDGQVD
jgi:hypothetical protein